MDETYLREIYGYYNKIKNRYTCVDKLYVVGGISSPGISDIDILMVIKDSSKRTIWSYIDPSNGSYKNLLHGPFVTTTNYLHELLSITTLKLNPSLCDGVKNKDQIKSLEVDTQIAIIRDSLFIKHFLEKEKNILGYVKRDLRFFLLVINSVCHSFSSILNTVKGLGIGGVDCSFLEKYIYKVKMVRSKWFDKISHDKDILVEEIIADHKKAISIAIICLNMSIRKFAYSQINNEFHHLNKYVIDQLSFIINNNIVNDPKKLYASDFELSISRFAKILAKHVKLYRERNLTYYGAGFLIPGTGVNLEASSRNIFTSKLLNKIGLNF